MRSALLRRVTPRRAALALALGLAGVAPIARPRPAAAQAGVPAMPSVDVTVRDSTGRAIAGAQVSRTTEGGEALMAVTVDSPVSAELLEEIAGRIGAREARAADLDTL